MDSSILFLVSCFFCNGSGVDSRVSFGVLLFDGLLYVSSEKITGWVEAEEVDRGRSP